MITHMYWLLGACLLSFSLAYLFGDILKLERRRFLVPFVLGVGGFLTLYAWSTGLDIGGLFQRNWMWGLLGGFLVGGVLALTVRSQPESERGSSLDLVWAGLVYGMLDGLLLSVMPVIAVERAFGPASGLVAQIGMSALALAASMLVTAAYHWGYAEFRGPRLVKALIGNSICTLAFLLTGSALAPVLSHAVMHVAAVLHGPETTIQLPPHQGLDTAAG